MNISVLGAGAMGAALIRSWLAAGADVTVWNRTAGRARAIEGVRVAGTVAEAVAASDLVIVVLLDDASVGQALAQADLAGKDVVNLTTSTPAEARARAEWVAARGARYLDGGIMAVPPMVGVPEAGGYVFYSGPAEAFEAHRDTLAVPLGTRYVGADAGLAALYDVALLSGMTGLFAGISHAFALVRGEQVDLKEFAALLTAWLSAMVPVTDEIAAQLASGDYVTGVSSNLAMMVEGNATLLRTADEQGVSPELLTPYMDLMARRLAAGHGDEGSTGVIELLDTGVAV
ncbi:NAD(P)-dependent oxidoreductase [Nonomuraea sp. NPDC050663]|uniref:NAD(P)-dependent oxidoreductase n=1 Tax=Nonomuraea sp. NPDC050663 TaxID=3364370 RepID=UPI003791AD02